jgi:hypothetical protein
MNAITIDKMFPNFLKMDLENLYLRYNENDIIFTLGGMKVAELKDNGTVKFETKTAKKVKETINNFINDLLCGKIELITNSPLN